MSVNTSVTGALVVLVIVMLIAGMVVGLALAGTDLFNPNTSGAKANQMNRASEYQAQKDAVDLEFYRREAEVRARAFEEQVHQEVEFRQQQYEQELAHQRELQVLALKWYEIRQGVLLIAAVIALLFLSVGLTFYLVSLGYRNLRQHEVTHTLARTNGQALQQAGYRSGEKLVAGGNGRRERALSG